jgi:hypothetical protein
MGGPGMRLDDVIGRDMAIGLVLVVGGAACLVLLAWGLWRRSGSG